MNRRLVWFVSLVLAGSALTLEAQSRRTTGPTREDQHPASSSAPSSRGEERSREPVSPPQRPDPPAPPRHDPPPQPVQATGPVGPPHPHPVGGVPIEVSGPAVILVPVSPAVSSPVDAIPLWPVGGVEIVDRLADPDNSGYNFGDGEIVAFNDDGADVYYESPDSLLRAADDTDVQDLGVSTGVSEDLRVRKDGWATGKSARLQAGHQYAIWRWNGDVVRLYVQEIVDGAVVFDWMPGRAMERTALQGPIFAR
jgi:hypothetical protein